MERHRRTPAGLGTGLLPHRWGRGWAVLGEQGAQPSRVLLGCCPQPHQTASPWGCWHGSCTRGAATAGAWVLPDVGTGCPVPSCASWGCADGHDTTRGSELRVLGWGSMSPPTESGWHHGSGEGRAAPGHGADPGPTGGQEVSVGRVRGCPWGELGLSITTGGERKLCHP